MHTCHRLQHVQIQASPTPFGEMSQEDSLTKNGPGKTKLPRPILNPIIIPKWSDKSSGSRSTCQSSTSLAAELA